MDIYPDYGGYVVKDIMNSAEIKKITAVISPDITRRLELIYKPLTGSTNTDARGLVNAAYGGRTLYAVIAEAQTDGRGTQGRSFYSPKGSGLYMSLLIPFGDCCDKLPLATPAAAVGVCDAVCSAGAVFNTEKDPSVKWVNDIYLGRKKICGILTESVMRDGGIAAVIIGIGINVYPPDGDFPTGLSGKAGAAFTERIQGLRNRLAAEVICRVTYAVCLRGKHEIISQYRKRCMTIGCTVDAFIDGCPESCTAEDITDDCHLLLRRADGSTFTVISSAQLLRYT